MANVWTRRVQLTGLPPSATLTGFVALVSLDNVPVEAIDAGANSALNGGGDLRFYTDQAGTNQLPLEVVEYVTDAVEGNRRCHLVIRFPTYSSGARDAWMFYGNSEATQPDVTDPFGRNAVYQDREYQYNLHNISSVIDSSGNSTPRIEGTLSNNQTSPFGSGVDFGIGEWLDLEQNIGDTIGDMTLRAWLEAPASTSFSTILSIRGAGGNNWSYQWRLEANDPAILIGSASPNSPGSPLIEGTWYFLVLTVSGTTITYYRDGISEGTETVSGTRDLKPLVPTYIAGVSDDTPVELIGTLADVSVEFGAISSDLVSSEYDNKNNAATFWITGTPEDIGPPEPVGNIPLIMNNYRQRRH